MTYLHAIQYLEGSAAASPPTRNATQAEERLYAAYLSALGNTEQKFLFLTFASDRAGLLSAAYCRAALLCAGIRVGEIGDAATGELPEVLRIDGAPVSPTVLRELCHTARAAEQQILRNAAKQAAAQDAEEAAATPPTSFSAIRRCGAVLSRLFADHGCRVILLIGDITDPRLRLLAATSPAHCVAVLSAGEHQDVQKFPVGTGEVVCPTCSRATFRRVTDACSHAGSRLTLTATSHLTSEQPTLFSRRFSYRNIRDCALPSGSIAALRAAMLASEALLALGRLGCPVPTEAIRRGYPTVTLPYFLSPHAIEPLLISHAICGADDTDVLLNTLEEFDAALPPRRFILCDASLPAREIDRLAQGGKVIPIAEDEPLTTHIFPSATDAKDTSRTVYFLVGSPAALAAHITRWQRTVRAL